MTGVVTGTVSMAMVGDECHNACCGVLQRDSESLPEDGSDGEASLMEENGTKKVALELERDVQGIRETPESVICTSILSVVVAEEDLTVLLSFGIETQIQKSEHVVIQKSC